MCSPKHRQEVIRNDRTPSLHFAFPFCRRPQELHEMLGLPPSRRFQFCCGRQVFAITNKLTLPFHAALTVTVVVHARAAGSQAIIVLCEFTYYCASRL